MGLFRKWIRNFFGFSATEINGFLILLPLMIALIVSEPIYRTWISSRPPQPEDTRRLDSIISIWNAVKKADSAVGNESLNRPLLFQTFDFDPNTVSLSDLELLGFSKILAKRIASYRQKGGQFRIRGDLKRIYGVDTILYRRLYSHILLPEKIEGKHLKRDSIGYTRNNLFVFDVNAADSAQFEKVKGIGPALASRILKYRAKLGGFVTTKQLKEVYGIDSVVNERLQQSGIIAKDFVPKKIDLNMATEAELSQHPYIGRTIARAVVSYRFQHGPFTSVEDLAKLPQLKSADIEKIAPYLTITR